MLEYAEPAADEFNEACQVALGRSACVSHVSLSVVAAPRVLECAPRAVVRPESLDFDEHPPVPVSGGLFDPEVFGPGSFDARQSPFLGDRDGPVDPERLRFGRIALAEAVARAATRTSTDDRTRQWALGNQRRQRPIP